MNLSRQLQSEMNRLFKEQGFKKKDTFYFQEMANSFLVFGLCKSKNFLGLLRFTFDVGMISKNIAQFMSPYKYESLMLSGVIDNSMFHLSRRIGFFLPEHKDIWWDITSIDDIEKIVLGFRHILLSIVDQLKKYDDITVLYQLWSEGKSFGLTEFQRILYSSVAAALIGRNEDLNRLLDELYTYSLHKPVQAYAEVYIDKLRAYQGL